MISSCQNQTFRKKKYSDAEKENKILQISKHGWSIIIVYIKKCKSKRQEVLQTLFRLKKIINQSERISKFADANFLKLPFSYHAIKSNLINLNPQSKPSDSRLLLSSMTVQIWLSPSWPFFFSFLPHVKFFLLSTFPFSVPRHPSTSLRCPVM